MYKNMKSILGKNATNYLFLHSNITNMKKVCIKFSGCRRRSLDAQRIKTYFEKNGYEIVYDPKIADINILGCCAFHEHMANTNLKKIEKFQRYKGELIVAGCLPIIEKEKLAKIFNGRTLGTKYINDIDKLFPDSKIKFEDIEDANFKYSSKKHNYIKSSLRKFKPIEKFYLKIDKFIYRNLVGKNSLQDLAFPRHQKLFHVRIGNGCNSKCTFCVIRKSNGPFKSKPLDQCIKEFKKGLSLGYKRFMITATNPGYYGLDINSSLAELFDNFTSYSGDFDISIRGVYPEFIIKYIDEFEESFKRNKIKSINIPIQSGSRRILKLMNRDIDLVKLKNAIKRLQDASPNLVIDCNYIIGFPTETDEDFQKTLNLIKEIDSKIVYFFPFSARPGTIANELEPKVTKKQMKQRKKIAKKTLKSYGYSAKLLSLMKLPLFQKNYK